MTRRAARIGLWGLAATCALVLGAWLLRFPLLELIIENEIATRGLPQPRLTVREADARHLLIEDVRLGVDDELTARKIIIEYTLAGLIRGRVDKLAIDGLSIHADVRRESRLLQRLRATAGTESRGDASPIEQIAVSGLEVSVATRIGTVVVRLDGQAASSPGGELQGRFDYRLEGRGSYVTGALDVSRALSGETAARARISRGTLALPGAELAVVDGEASARWLESSVASLDGELSLVQGDVPGARLHKATLGVDLRGGAADVAARVAAADGRWWALATLAVQDYLDGGTVHLALQGEAAAEADIWQLLALPVPERGHLSATLDAAARVGPLVDKSARPRFIRPSLGPDGVGGRLVLESRDLTYAPGIDGVSAKLEAKLAVKDGAIELVPVGDVELKAKHLDAPWLADRGLPPTLARALGGSATVTLRALDDAGLLARLDTTPQDRRLAIAGTMRLRTSQGVDASATARVRSTLDQRLRPSSLSMEHMLFTAQGLRTPIGALRDLRIIGRLRGNPDALTGELDTTLVVDGLAVEPVMARQVKLSLRANVSTDFQAHELELTSPGSIELHELQFPERIRTEAPVKATVRAAKLRVARTEKGTLVFDHRLSLDAKELRIAGLRGAERFLSMQGSVGRLDWEGEYEAGSPYAPRLRVTDARVQVPEHHVDAENISATLDLGAADDEPFAKIGVGAVRQSEGATRTIPLKLQGSVRRRARSLELSLTGFLPEGMALLAVNGRMQTEPSRGELTMTLNPVRFAPGTRQPKDLLLGLESLRAVTGEVKGTARVSWQPGAVAGNARVDLDRLSFKSGDIAVKGLTLDLHLDQLFPPASAPGQRLEIERIDAGVPLEGVAVRFQVLRGERPRLALASVDLRLGGGRFFVREATLDPNAARQALTLNVEDLDLAQLTSIMAIKGLSGTGRLSGAFPLQVARNALVIGDGRLDSTGPGVLKYQSEQATRALAGSGESVDLMLKALQNFHYETLSVTVRKPADGDARLALSILGRNPDVLDGHPFRLNINVEGHTGKLLAAVASIHGLTSEMLRRAWMLNR